VGNQIVSPVGQQPIPFSVAVAPDQIDPDLTYTVQAQVQDGGRVWQTSGGVKVLTLGNPSSDVPVPLAYQPDLLKGEVAGQITGVGVQLTQGSYSAAALVRIDTGEIVGIDTSVSPGSVPIPFLLAFDPATIDPNADYVVEAKIVSGETTWNSAVGVPVITNGNPLTGVTVSVAEETPPSPAPATSQQEGGGTPLWLILLVIALAVALVVLGVSWFRARKSAGAPSTGDGPTEDQPPSGDLPSAGAERKE
jgi:uncharacterized lipoprotein YbaY